MFIIIIIYAAAVVEIISKRENKILESVLWTHWIGKQECT